MLSPSNLNNNCLTATEYTSMENTPALKSMSGSTSMVIPPNTSPAFLTYCPTLALMLTEVSGLSIMVPTPPPKLLKMLSSAVSKSFTKSPPQSSKDPPPIFPPPSPVVWEILSTKKVPSTPGLVLNPINNIILPY